MEGYQQVHNQYTTATTAGINIDSGTAQWSFQETQNFLMIRAELDSKFMDAKRNGLLWESISMKMKEKGFSKSAEQCRCKWKNLVTRFKGYETTEAEGMRQQFPFYSELEAIFDARVQRMVWPEAEGGPNLKKKAVNELTSDESEEETTKSGRAKKKRKIYKGSYNIASASGSSSIITSEKLNVITCMREIMDKFMKQQLQIEKKWLKAFEEREEQRVIKEMEWRKTMEDSENERIMMDRRWRNGEEQRRIREEARAEKMDLLITTILNKLLTREN